MEDLGLAQSATLARRRSRIRRRLRSDWGFKWIPFIPAELSILFLTTPFILLVFLALTRWRVTMGPWWAGHFAGLYNFVNALTDPRFIESFFRSLYFSSIVVPAEAFIGFGLAYLAHKPFKGQKVFSIIWLIPMMVVPVVVGYNSNMLFVQQGPVNQILSLVTGRDIQIGWLSSTNSAQAAVICSDIWQWTPLMFLIFMSGFSAIPKEPLNAAKVLGASTWQVFRYIQLPLMRPVILMAVVLRTMESLKIFDIPMLLTQGGPGNATETVAIYLYRTTWEQMRVSNGAGMSILLFIFTLMLIFICIKILKTQRMRIEEEAWAK